MSEYLFETHLADALHERLRVAVEVERQAYLWVPEDVITFTPRLLPVICGDGRALFRVTTINNRPAYWVVRGCSTWGCGDDREGSSGPDFAEITDELMTELEEAFGVGRCGYSGNSLFFLREERIQDCQCEECDDEYVARWPVVDCDGGCSWSRMCWPDGFLTKPHPLSYMGDLLLDAMPGAQP